MRKLTMLAKDTVGNSLRINSVMYEIIPLLRNPETDPNRRNP